MIPAEIGILEELRYPSLSGQPVRAGNRFTLLPLRPTIISQSFCVTGRAL